MLRIRGSIGDWPVDLTLELDEGDWAQLGAQLQAAKPESVAVAAKPASQDDALSVSYTHLTLPTNREV